ncbi:prophage maintenance system killer protein/prophage antirepressor-like protein [Hymenobacter luteus]|uniref:Prophage maintenance system killer protein/prophage antirepressor-like protein n=2 Tax=Hymenobacter TaxID=89966 RepID=A0A7W9WBM8_9BACT|nr:MULTISPECIES: virulence protein RhuM/Fic/DOC family protein [Hymenobacter]MBB4601287.1 prophage maintenance system killer protein/prophage antirepressor-like protein [Hymenobacter latericoloratus]MBB6058506.1 prophage maintenance system killer protein/prophage antirepressor-like protein [Hymenobacter luteus]
MPAATTATPDIILYQSADGQTRLDVHLQNETIWLTQAQMADLFGRERSVITKHLRAIFQSDELDEESNVQKMHIAFSDKPVTYYNLDVIISVGYRVNSKKGTQFRQWATQVLRQYLVRGYALNEQRLREDARQLADLKRLLQLQGEIADSQELTPTQTTALLRVLSDYARALDVLDQYDHQRLRITATSPDTPFELTYEAALQAVDSLREQFGGSILFGREKDESFQSSVRTIYQSFGGVELYPSVEEKAANLLYFVVKNHSFSDGNKRIAAFLFVWFMDKNGCLYKADGSRRLADNALVALTLLIAESKPEDKEVMVKLVVNLINQEN